MLNINQKQSQSGKQQSILDSLCRTIVTCSVADNDVLFLGCTCFNGIALIEVLKMYFCSNVVVLLQGGE